MVKMNEEIKEILDIIECWKNGDYVLAYSFNYDKASNQNNKILNYITNLQEENQKLKSNQVKTFNKIKDHINGCNCEISEGHYSNDNHSNYWKMFKEILEDIKNNLKKYDNNGYVYIPAWREKELLRIEEENEKLNKVIEDIDKYIHIFKIEDIGEKTMLILNDILLIKNGLGKDVVRLNKLTELKKRGGINDKKRNISEN